MTAPALDVSVEALEAMWQQGQEIREHHKAIRREPPLIRMWANPPQSSGHNGLLLRGKVVGHTAEAWPFKINKAMTGKLRLRIDHFLAKWVYSLPNTPEAKKNVVITVDFGRGAMTDPTKGPPERFSGLMKHWEIVNDKDGLKYMEIFFVDDTQFPAFILGAPNPILPIPIFQFPRVLPIFGPGRWAPSMMVLLNLIRIEGNLWSLPDDPFDVGSWTESWDMSKWQVLIKCPSFFEDPSLWTLDATRMDPLDRVVEDGMDDGELMWKYRRIITVDGETSPVPGVPTVRNGALVLEIVDRSGYYDVNGTGTRYNAINGFIRTVTTFVDGFLVDADNVINGDPGTFPPQYFLANFLGVIATHPFLVIRDGPGSGIRSQRLSHAPAGPYRIVVGGDNPFANQAAELMIQSIGNILGYFLLAGFDSAGDMAATVIMPLIAGTIFAWDEFEHTTRAQQNGWVKLMEHFQTGANNNAWSLSAVAAIRAGIRATAAETSHELTSIDSNFIIGVHATYGDRVGNSMTGMEERPTLDQVFVDRIEEMEYTADWTTDNPPGWNLKVGKSTATMSLADRSTRLLSKSLATLQNLGVNIIS